MPTIYLNRKLNFNTEQVWEACNGATRTRLVLVNKLGNVGETFSVEASLSTYEKGKHCFIFLNPPKPGDNRVLGIFLCKEYGYKVIKGEELYSASSYGGPGNSESKFGIYTLGTILAAHSYKHRQGDSYYELKPDGWYYLGRDIILPEEMKYAKEI